MSLPNVRAGLWGLQGQIQFRKIVIAVVDFEAVATEAGQASVMGGGGFGNGPFEQRNGRPVNFGGVLQPFSPQRINILPEGQRTWKFWRLWTTKVLALNDIVVDQTGKRYKVMEIYDWSQGGYTEYAVTETFDAVAPS